MWSYAVAHEAKYVPNADLLDTVERVVYVT
jgi:hypothetical protein